MVITWVSKPGGREVNEDAVAKARKKGIVCIVVADGLGGHNGGSIASALAVETVIESFNKNPGFSREHLEEYIENAKTAIVKKAMESPELLHMSSTAAVLLIKGRRAMWATVGDTRLYRFNYGEIAEVSEDHSVAFADFACGRIEYGEIRSSENQNKLTSALGVAMDGANFSEEIRIDTSQSFLICTDGWWKYVSEEDMENTCKSAPNAGKWLGKMLEICERNAPDNCDNYTAAVVVM